VLTDLRLDRGRVRGVSVSTVSRRDREPETAEDADQMAPLASARDEERDHRAPVRSAIVATPLGGPRGRPKNGTNTRARVYPDR